MKLKFKTIGSDPEFFVLDPKGRPYPATLFAKGTKDIPCPIVGAPTGFYEQRDNLSFEGNIPPASSKEDFIYNMNYLRNYFQGKVAKHGYTISPNGVEYFDKRYRETAEGMEFGCSSVISAWDSSPFGFRSRPTPNMSGSKFRVAGFHLHIGYCNTGAPYNKPEDIMIGRLFDLFLTIPSQKIKPEPERLQSYGAYGMIRVKEYGVECRTLSTFFTQPKYLPWIWDQLMKIEEFLNLCSQSNRNKIVDNRYITGTTEDSMKTVFVQVFNEFTNKNILTKFEETNEIYEDKRFNKKPTREKEILDIYNMSTATGTSDSSPYSW